MATYIYVCGQCRTKFMLPNPSRRQFINMYFYDGIVSHIYFYDGKVSRIDGASVTKILCLHVLIGRRILLILDMLIIVSKTINVSNVSNRVNNFILWFYHLAYMCTAHVLMRFCHLIHRSFVCKAKEGRHIRMSDEC